jgi:hypothetical protein
MLTMSTEQKVPPSLLVINCNDLTFSKISELLSEQMDRLAKIYPEITSAPPVVIRSGYPASPVTEHSHEHLEGYDAPIIPRVNKMNGQVISCPMSLNPLQAWEEE